LRERFRGARLHAGWFLSRLSTLNTKVTLDYGLAVAQEFDDAEGANHQTELAADAFVSIDQDGIVVGMSVYRSSGTNRDTRRIFAMPALYGHCELTNRLDRDSPLRLG
jgi:hypothetical protein